MAARNLNIGASDNSKWDLEMTRIFDAPRELVFQAWTEAEHVAAWWGPKGFTNSRCEIDFRVGGSIRIDMRAPDGKVYPMTGIFQEIDRPNRLAFLSSALDADDHSMFDVLNIVTFADRGDKTELRLQARVVKATAVAPQYLKGMEMGWSQTLDRLAAKVTEMSRH